VLFFTFFVNNAPQITAAGDLVALLQQEIASVFVSRFTFVLQLLYREEKPFQVKGTDLKIVASWRYDTCRNARENFQNVRKWVQNLCAPLRPFRSKVKEVLPQPFTPCIVDVYPYKIFCYLVTGCHKKLSICSGSAKNGRQCHHLYSPKCYLAVQFKKCFGGFL